MLEEKLSPTLITPIMINMILQRLSTAAGFSISVY